ncbi:hypothetical protein ACWD5R_34465 [Streptomyces sp. NPDC002514]|uniref:hypothetical protein n=1 Tax=Streptomyces sp. NPDC001270 TaxID=3364554 RepID=UPI0036C78AC3
MKLPAVVRTRGRDRLLSSICALLLAGGGVLVLTPESAVVALRRLTGVTNCAVPLIYILLMAFSGASVVLVLHWRGGPAVAHTRRLSRITVLAYGIVCALIALLFTLGHTPAERRRDFDTYYATTPFIREMIVPHLVAHAVATLTAGRLCWRWSHKVRGDAPCRAAHPRDRVLDALRNLRHPRVHRRRRAGPVLGLLEVPALVAGAVAERDIGQRLGAGDQPTDDGMPQAEDAQDRDREQKQDREQVRPADPDVAAVTVRQVADAWRRITGWLRHNAPDSYAALRPGAGPAAIAASVGGWCGSTASTRP